MLVSPTAIYAILMLAAPLVTILAFSFFKDGYLTVIREFTFENYIATWTDPIFRAILLRSLIVSGLVTLVTVLLAFPIAYYVSFHVTSSKKSRWLFLITIPFWTCYLIRVFPVEGDPWLQRGDQFGARYSRPDRGAVADAQLDRRNRW